MTRVVRYRRQVARYGVGAGLANAYRAYDPTGRHIRNFGRGVGRSLGSATRSYLSGPSRYQRDAYPSPETKSAKPMMKSAPKKGYRKSGYKGKFNGRMKPKRTGKGPLYQCDVKGLTFVNEFGSTSSDALRCLTIGHATHPEAVLERLLYGSIVRLILNKVGYSTQNFAQNNSMVRTSDIVRIRYRLNFDNAAQAETFISYTCTNDDPMSTIVTGIITAARIIGGKTAQLNFEYAEFISANDSNDGSRCKVNLVGASVYVSCASTLTIQNRTDNGETNPTSEELDSIPLLGKVYEGPGTGAKFKWSPTTAGVADLHQNPVAQDNGMIIYADGTSTSLYEPLPHWSFSNVTKSNAITIPSGSIKDSYIKHQQSMALQSLIGVVYTTGAATREYLRLGKYKFYMIEKHIEPSIGTPTNAIKIAWQVNLKCGAFIKLKRAQAAVQENFIGSGLPLA